MVGPVRTLVSRFGDLSEEESEVWNLVHPERSSLAKLRRLSLRNRAWFRVLNQGQRRFMDVVIKTVDRIRSILLLRVLAPLARRLLAAVGGDARRGALVLMDKGAYRMMRNVAEKIVRVAQKWGNRRSREWLDQSFLNYLLVMNLPQNHNNSMGTC
jgi:hypothetical protein